MAFNLWRVHTRLFTKHRFNLEHSCARVIQTRPAAYPHDG